MRYGPYGVRVNAIAPGTLRTPAWEEAQAEGSRGLRASREVVSARPHRRAGGRGRSRPLPGVGRGRLDLRRRAAR